MASRTHGFAASPGDDRVLWALGKMSAGRDAELLSRELTWSEFEDLCAEAIKTAGYSVRRNLTLRRPRRQLDLLAESSTMGLSVDCKHWKRGVGEVVLERLALAQVERTRQYKLTLDAPDKPFLPLLLTMVDNGVRVVAGVPIVPLFALKDFLTNVSRFDEELVFV
jgi:hypothetical protein